MKNKKFLTICFAQLPTVKIQIFRFNGISNAHHFVRSHIWVENNYRMADKIKQVSFMQQTCKGR